MSSVAILSTSRRCIITMSLVVINSDNYPGFSKRGAEFPRGKGTPKSPPVISIKMVALRFRSCTLNDV